jgi:2,3-bisphosphoglycerate-independent phosphoglycerate mutase
MTLKSPTVLIVLDGWGHREDADDNAISRANTPVWDRLWQERPRGLISGSGLDVGLPSGQMGNSEVGHMNLGAGRIIHQDFTRISQAIEEGSFFTNPVLQDAMRQAAAGKNALHLFGLLSPGGVHSHEEHIKAAVDMGRQCGVDRIYVHAFLDGRDVPPRSAEPSLAAMDAHIRASGKGGIASIVGRYYAMDRDNRWERVAPAYEMIISGTGEFSAENAVTGLAAAYAREESDEFVKPTAIPIDGSTVRINDGDAVIFMNFRADRAREMTRAFVETGFDDFERSRVPDLSSFVCLTEYAADIEAPSAYPPESIHNSLGEYVASLGLKQLRLAETEKYAHVTFFFSGGREAEYTGEERKLIPSPRVATYDLQPEMSAPEVTDALTAAIRSRDFDLIICNYANGDMVGHTGNYDAAVLAVECLDACLGRVVEALEEVDGQCLITADHGNVEQMSDHMTGQPHTAHTSEFVPLVYIGSKDIALQATGGVLSDVAPTLLALMDLAQPVEMSGSSLLTVTERQTASA